MTTSHSPISGPLLQRRDQIFEIYRPIVGPIVRGLAPVLPGTVDADDVTQTANVALLDAVTRFEGYLRTRIRGAVIDSVKGPAYLAEKALRIDEFPEFSAAPIPIEERIDEERRLCRFDAAVASLAGPDRTVIEMKRRGSNETQIARQTGVVPRTVRRRHAVALTELRSKLAA